MPGRTSSFLALATALALLLMSVSIDRSMAGHDLTEALTNYKESCAAYKHLFSATQPLRDKRAELNAQYNSHCEPYSYGNEYCNKLYDSIRSNNSAIKMNEFAESYLKKDCDQFRSKYLSALTQRLTEAVLTGALPEPGTIPPQNVKKPKHSFAASNRRRRRPPVRTTRKPPQVGHSTAQTQALAAIGGLIIQGIQRGNRRSQSSGGKPHSHGGGGSPSGGGGGVKSPGGGVYVHSPAASTHQDRIRRGM